MALREMDSQQERENLDEPKGGSFLLKIEKKKCNAYVSGVESPQSK